MTSTIIRSGSRLRCFESQQSRDCEEPRAPRQSLSRFRSPRCAGSVVDPSGEGWLMHPTHLCIVARPMSRTAGRAMRIVTVVMLVASLFGCEQLDGRNRNRKGNNLFREMRFADAAGEYEKALKEVDDPTIHYNLGLAYSKVFKPGFEGSVEIEQQGTPA